MQAIEKDILSTPGVALLSNAGGSFSPSIRRRICSIAHMRSSSRPGPVLDRNEEGNPAECFQGKTIRRRTWMQVRRRLQKYSPMRTGVRNAPSFIWRRRRFDIDFNLRGPDIVALRLRR